MKFFGTIVAAVLVSMLLGGVATLALFTLVSCWQAGCALSGIPQLALMPFYAGLGAIVFAGAALWKKRRQETMFYGLRLLMLIPIVLIVAGLAAGASPRAKAQFDLVNAVLLSIPFWVVIGCEWWIVQRSFVLRETMRS